MSDSPTVLRKRLTPAQTRRVAIRSCRWKLEFATSFDEAERQTREYWRNATPAERLGALETLREPFYGPDQASRRLQRFLELVPFP
jgi:hypothetical protein